MGEVKAGDREVEEEGGADEPLKRGDSFRGDPEGTLKTDDEEGSTENERRSQAVDAGEGVARDVGLLRGHASDGSGAGPRRQLSFVQHGT
jgi:hypothetical protein